MHRLPLLFVRAFVALCGSAALTSGIVAPTAAAQTVARRRNPVATICATMRPYLDSIHAAGKVPAFAVGIALPDGSSCGIAVGIADTARKTVLDAQSLLLTGSVGKTYVAAVAMQLLAEGRLDLDAPISRYLAREPWFGRVANASVITVRHLMTHSSGIVRYEFDPRFLKDLTANPQRTWTPADRIAYLLDKPAPFLPGAGWEYSDTNYIVLGLIIERITGRALNDEIRRRLLAPLQLTETRASDSPNIRGLAQGYAGPRNEFGNFDAMVDAKGRFVINPQFEWAGGGYASSPRDLARWMSDYFEGRAYPDSLVSTATNGIAARGLGQGASYGLGVIIRPSPSGMTWGHSGFFPGYLTEARYWPEHGFAVTMQINTSVSGALGRAPGQVVNEIARRLVAASSPLQRLDTTAIASALRAEMQATSAPGASVAVVIGDRVVYASAMGVRSVESGEAMTSASLIRIGSVTKSFTGLMAAILAAEGKVDVRAPISSYAPQLNAAIGTRTLHDLLTHSAGMVDEGAANGAHDDRALEDRVLGWRDDRLFASTGDVYSYSSPGYWLSGYLLQRATNTPYADLVSQRILRPLGMMRSTFRPLDAMTFPLALDHRVTAGKASVLRPFQDDASTWPSGSLFTSADELARYAIALVNDGMIDGKQVIPKEAVRSMLRAQFQIPGESCSYSYGLSLCDRGSYRSASHYGFRVGSGAVFTLIPRQRVAIVVLANRNGGIFGRTESAILRMLFPERTVAAAPANAAGDGAARDIVPSRAESAALRARYVGRWAMGRDTLTITLRGDSVLYRYGPTEQRTLIRGDVLNVLGANGATEESFRLVKGARSDAMYLHSGLSAFRRVPN